MSNPEVCKTCGDTREVWNCHYYKRQHQANECKKIPCPDCQPPADKKYYCKCGAEMEIKPMKDGEYSASCSDGDKPTTHYDIGYMPNLAALLAELEKLEVKK